jgi:hypothetical protein
LANPNNQTRLKNDETIWRMKCKLAERIKQKIRWSQARSFLPFINVNFDLLIFIAIP